MNPHRLTWAEFEASVNDWLRREAARRLTKVLPRRVWRGDATERN